MLETVRRLLVLSKQLVSLVRGLLSDLESAYDSVHIQFMYI